jgi:hypothetical protein
VAEQLQALTDRSRVESEQLRILEERLSTLVASTARSLLEKVESEGNTNRHFNRGLEERLLAVSAILDSLPSKLSSPVEPDREESDERLAVLESRLAELLDKIGSSEVSGGEARLMNVQQRIGEFGRYLEVLLPRIAIETSLLHYVLWRNQPGEKEQKDQIFDLAQTKATERVGKWLEEFRTRADISSRIS